MAVDNAEDILSDFLELLGEDAVKDNGTVQYGDLTLTIAPKEGKALTLLADQLFSPSLLLSERIERRLISLRGSTVLELGAGCALPSLIAASLPPDEAPARVVVTDYPDGAIISNLRANVLANASLYASKCIADVQGYEWGADMRPLLDALPDSSPRGYDVLFLSDLLHFASSHTELLVSLTALLARTPHARAYVAAGRYTPSNVCDAFLRAGEAAGLVWEEGDFGAGKAEQAGERSSEDERVRPASPWQGEARVWHAGRQLSLEELRIRKGMCRWWVGRWAVLESVR